MLKFGSFLILAWLSPLPVARLALDKFRGRSPTKESGAWRMGNDSTIGSQTEYPFGQIDREGNYTMEIPQAK